MIKFPKSTAAFLALTLTFPMAGLTQEASGSDLSLGQEIIDGVAVGSTYTRETYGDWDMRCVRTSNDKDPCQLYQLMKDDNGNPVAEISMFELPGGQPAVAGATVAAPLQTLLTEQITISVDGKSSKRYPFSYCAELGCYARLGLTADDLADFKRGIEASVLIVPATAPDQRVSLKLSLIGFTKGFDAVIDSNKEITAN